MSMSMSKERTLLNHHTKERAFLPIYIVYATYHLLCARYKPSLGGGIAPSGSFRYSGIALSALANLKSLRFSASGRKKKVAF
jgi:hypothetical protein